MAPAAVEANAQRGALLRRTSLELRATSREGEGAQCSAQECGVLHQIPNAAAPMMPAASCNRPQPAAAAISGRLSHTAEAWRGVPSSEPWRELERLAWRGVALLRGLPLNEVE